jgi:hypothetical protein
MGQTMGSVLVEFPWSGFTAFMQPAPLIASRQQCHSIYGFEGQEASSKKGIPHVCSTNLVSISPSPNVLPVLGHFSINFIALISKKCRLLYL